jgi:rhomboid family GlyGly-CTERM serine protease
MKGKMPSGWILTLLAVGAILVQLAGPTVQEALRYEQEAVFVGELWRLFSGHLVHLGWPHTLWNVSALVVVSLLFGGVLSERHWGAVALFCAVGIGIGLLAFKPEVGVYVGLSGVLHGLFAAGAAADMKAHPRTSAIILGLLGAKLAWEQLAGPLPGTEAAVGGMVLIDAHLYGAALGIAAVVILQAITAATSQDKSSQSR